jgi:hypothetical protein
MAKENQAKMSFPPARSARSGRPQLRSKVLVTAPHLSDVTQGKTAVTGVKAGEASHRDHSSDDGDDVKENRPHNGGGGRLARSRAAAASDTL